MQCISTVSYSYLINDTTQGSVKPQRGIRQGDPLSPYLFILWEKVLSGLWSKAKRVEAYAVLKWPDTVQESIICFSQMIQCSSIKPHLQTAKNSKASSYNMKKPQVSV